MILCFISDTHTQHQNLKLNMLLEKVLGIYPDAVLVHCGDISIRGSMSEVTDFMDWFSSLRYKYKIVIPGNHDFFFDHGRKARTYHGEFRHGKPIYSQEDVKKLLDVYPGVYFLNDSGVDIEGIKFWGSPITPWFHDWAFNRWENEIEDHWNMIPDDTNVLITHGPPYGILDYTYNGYKNVGCPALSARIQKLEDLMVHSFGHIHESFGVETEREITYINASFLNISYNPVNYPVIFDTEEKKSYIFSDLD